MQKCSKKITREVYCRAAQNHGCITKEDYNNVFTESERWGYGVYGNSVYEENGEFFVSYLMGDTCD